MCNAFIRPELLYQLLHSRLKSIIRRSRQKTHSKGTDRIEGTSQTRTLTAAKVTLVDSRNGRFLQKGFTAHKGSIRGEAQQEGWEHQVHLVLS